MRTENRRYMMSEKIKGLRPGEATPVSGQYLIRGTKKEVTGVEGKPLPPTPRPGQKYDLVDKTKH